VVVLISRRRWLAYSMAASVGHMDSLQALRAKSRHDASPAITRGEAATPRHVVHRAVARLRTGSPRSCDTSHGLAAQLRHFTRARRAVATLHTGSPRRSDSSHGLYATQPQQRALHARHGRDLSHVLHAARAGHELLSRKLPRRSLLLRRLLLRGRRLLSERLPSRGPTGRANADQTGRARPGRIGRQTGRRRPG
jgi:hypothetical protein